VSDQMYLPLEHEVSRIGAWAVTSANDAGAPRAVERGFGQLLMDPLESLEEGVEQELYYALPSIRDNFVEEASLVSTGSYRDDQTLVGSETYLSR
jgi:hypothetical protein